jgi:hypothetical protein
MSKLDKLKDKKIEEIYLERLRKMSGEERMKRAFELTRFAWRLAEVGIRNQFPNILDNELKEKLKQRLHR